MFKFKYVFVFSLCLLALSAAWTGAQAQNLLEEKIWKITSKKRSVFLEKGVFHTGSENTASEAGTLMAARHFYSKKQGYERMVFDFDTAKIPRIYGHISVKDRKLYLDFFNTKINPKIAPFGKAQFVERLYFFPVTKESLSVEIFFKQKASVDIFYLESPARLVIDIKNS